MSGRTEGGITTPGAVDDFNCRVLWKQIKCDALYLCVFMHVSQNRCIVLRDML
jgi:hypothetical protein